MQRSASEKAWAEQRFPVRLRLFTPEFGFGEQLSAMMAWLDIHCGKDRYTLESCQGPGRRDALLVYFDDPLMAADFSRRFDNGRMIACDPEPDREREHAQPA
jgi:hypothetical protein